MVHCGPGLVPSPHYFNPDLIPLGLGSITGQTRLGGPSRPTLPKRGPYPKFHSNKNNSVACWVDSPQVCLLSEIQGTLQPNSLFLNMIMQILQSYDHADTSKFKPTNWRRLKRVCQWEGGALAIYRRSICPQ